MRRILLLGPHGQLGSDLRRRYDDLGAATVLPLGRPALDATDLGAANNVLEAIEFDVAINCVAETNVDGCEVQPANAVALNSHFPALVARICARKGARLIQISTDYVFGGQSSRAPLNEDEPRAPLNVYGATKGIGEDLARLEHDDILIIRVASLFGVAGASGKGGNFVETIIRAARERGELRVVADQTMSPTSTADAAVAISQIIEHDAPAGVYHLVNSGEASWWEFASAIVSDAGANAQVTPISTAEYPRPARRPPYSALDTEKVTALLACPMPPWQDALRRYLVSKGHRAA